MQKSKPHYKLQVIKTLLDAGKVRATFTALANGAALGFDFEGIVHEIKRLTTKDFYKSMTTHADHKIWQDVYRPSTHAGDIYVKLTVIDDVLIVSFKEL